MFLFFAQGFDRADFAVTNLDPYAIRVRAGFWLRVLQYNVDRYQAASLEDRAIASLKLVRAQEAVDRLGGSGELDLRSCIGWEP